MSTHRTDRMEYRLRRFADAAADQSPARAIQFEARGNPLRAIAVILTVAAAVILTVATLQPAPEVGLVPGGSSPASNVATPSPDMTSPSASPSASPTGSTTPSMSIGPTAEPSIPGELPPPGASVPPRPAPFGDLSIYEIYAAALRHGLTCESSPFMGGESGLFMLGCESTEGGVFLRLTAAYWAVDYVDGVRAGAVSAGAGAIDGRTVLPLLEDALRTALDDNVEDGAITYVLDHYDDGTCGPDAACRMLVEEGELLWLVGENGARQVNLSVPRG